jgi:hypothetical protein
MVLMLATRHRGGVVVAEGLEADAAGVVAGVLHTSLHERRRGGQLALHLHLLIHLRTAQPIRLALPAQDSYALSRLLKGNFRIRPD